MNKLSVARSLIVASSLVTSALIGAYYATGRDVSTFAPVSSANATGISLKPTVFDPCKQMFLNKTAPYVPNSLGKVRELCFADFAVLHSGSTKTPVFAAEKLNNASLFDASDERRTDVFYEEARLPSADRALLSEYKGSGFDRGHMAAAAQRTTPEAMAQSFSLANMIPQDSANNRGVWARSVESATRKYVQRASGDVFVITGPYYDPGVSPRFIGQVRIPDAIYKVVNDPSSGKIWAYWTPNENVRKPEILSYDQIVAKTGINFFPR